MGQITQDGYTFNSDWIDQQLAILMNGTIPGDVRRYKLIRELEAHRAAMKCIPEMLPNDHVAMAHAKAYLSLSKKPLTGSLMGCALALEKKLQQQKDQASPLD